MAAAPGCGQGGVHGSGILCNPGSERREGTLILKFFLNVSQAEQKSRFLDRLDEPDKHWKFSSADLRKRALWDRYMDAYGHAIAATAAPHAPWFVVPADRK